MTHTGLFSNNWKEEISLSWSPPEDVCEALKMGDIRFEYVVDNIQYTCILHIRHVYSMVATQLAS